LTIRTKSIPQVDRPRDVVCFAYFIFALFYLLFGLFFASVSVSIPDPILVQQ